MRAPARRLSFEQLYAAIRALPEGQTGMILEPGELTVMSRPHPRHQRAMKGLLRALGPWDVDAGGTGWWVLGEVEVHLPDDRLLVPDLLGYRVEKVPDLPDENPLRVVPDWTCEILSPGSARDDRLKKLRIYAAHGVPWTWIVDPDARSVECFESVDGLPRQALVAQEDDEVSLPPFDLPIAIGRIWGAPRNPRD
ncbi:MAG: Uma2 family endonuclease [Myxococcales bacterium]|nr:Uma2 family endonuclease [Myxococcales bacterium]